jgi:hypothetical protein
MNGIIVDVKKSKKSCCFLGGTCADSTWREDLIPLLRIDYFNPVVEDWTPECQEEEIRQREECDFCLYVLTPRMQGYYSIAEVVDDSNKRPEKVVFCVLEIDVDDDGKILHWDEKQIKSFNAIKNMVKNNGGVVLEDLAEVAHFLNYS